jgi:glyoxylase-like metal-dependent hydrolase (beta-lactamase superfamily II)
MINKKALSLVAFKYGETVISARQVFYGIQSDEYLPVSLLFYLIKTKKQNILVDTGFSDFKKFESFGFPMKSFCKPSTLMKGYGITPEDITDVIITHAHYDHCADIQNYTNAVIYIHEAEAEICREQMKSNKKVVTFKNEICLYENFYVRHIGGHSAGSSIVIFEYNGKQYVLAGDECYLNKCLTEKIPTGSTYDLQKSKNFVSKYSDKAYQVLLFHDCGIIKEKTGYKEIEKSS